VDATSGPAHIKFFVKAISSTHDEVALTKGNSEKKLTPPHNVPAIRKKTYLINNRELVPNFAARWQLFRKYFPTPKSTFKRDRTLTTTVTKNTRFTLKRRPQHTRKTKSIMIKTQHRLKGERNTTTPSSMQCMTIQRCLHYNFVKAISSTYDENSTYQQK
jgi:site-specific DNA-cytosine methylase